MRYGDKGISKIPSLMGESASDDMLMMTREIEGEMHSGYGLRVSVMGSTPQLHTSAKMRSVLVGRDQLLPSIVYQAAEIGI